MTEFDAWATDDEQEQRAIVAGLSYHSTVMVPIETPEDLTAAIEHAEVNTRARWYTVKRAAVLGLLASIPEDWDRSGLRIDIDQTSFEMPDQRGVYRIRHAQRTAEYPPD